MGNERRLRLIQAAKEFKVGLNTITDFLQKKGIKCDGANSLVDEATYAILEKEYGSNRAAAGARDSVRERISQKQTSISLDGTSNKAKEEEKEVIIKSNMIHVKDEIQQPKFLGKIDLDAKKPEPKKEKPAVKREPVDHGRIVALYNAGWSMDKIADDVGCSAQTVANHLKKEGLRA